MEGRGIKLFFLKRLRTNFGRYLSLPRIQTGLNEYWYFVGEDGEWINGGIEDFDKRRREVKLQLDSVDLRNQRAALQKLLRDNYKKEKWWERFAPYIALAILILLLGVSSWLTMDKQIDAIQAGKVSVERQNELAGLQKEIIGGMDNLCSNSGIRTVS